MIAKLGGLVVGVGLALLTIMVIEALGHRLFPLDRQRATDLPLPVQSLLPIVVGWFLGTLIGGYAAIRMGAAGWEPWAVALAIIGSVLVAFLMSPFPAWMLAAGVLLPLLAAWIARKLV